MSMESALGSCVMDLALRNGVRRRRDLEKQTCISAESRNVGTQRCSCPKADVLSAAQEPSEGENIEYALNYKNCRGLEILWDWC